MSCSLDEQGYLSVKSKLTTIKYKILQSAIAAIQQGYINLILAD